MLGQTLKLDRLGRSLRDLIAMLDDLRARGVKFHSLTEAIDTATPTRRAMWQMIGVPAELGRSLVSERTRPRSESGAAPRGEVWPQGETHAGVARPRAKVDRQRRSPPVCGQPTKRGPLQIYRAR
jgi:DNA invertase Pin-like site-specific DNA recombinase